MLVIYTDIYLTKLWTVYEVACFLSTHEARDMVLMPVYLPVVVYSGVAIFYFATVLELILQARTPFWQVVYLTYGVGGFAASYIFRRWSREKAKIRDTMVHFRVQNCTCFCEADRPLVYSNISKMMVDTGQVGVEAEEAEGLEAFNTMVRESLPHVLTASGSPSYRHIVAIFLVTFFTRNVESRLGEPSWKTDPEVTQETIRRLHICWSVVSCIWVFAGMPLAVAFNLWWGERCLHLRGWREAVFLGLGTLLMLLMGVVADVSLQVAALMGTRGSTACMVVLLVVLASSTLLTIMVYTWRKRSKKPVPDNSEQLQPEGSAQV